MSFISNLGKSLASSVDSLLSAAEERTPNLDDYAPRDYMENEKRPRELKTGDAIVAVEYKRNDDQIFNSGFIAGTVFSVDKRNELVLLLTDKGQEIVKWYEARFFDEKDLQAEKMKPSHTMKREDMEDGVIYDAEIID